MSRDVFFILATTIALKLVIALFLILHKKNILSIILEVIASILVGFILYDFHFMYDLFHVFVIIEGELILTYFLTYLLIVVIRISAFKVLVSITHDGTISGMLSKRLSRKNLYSKMNKLFNVEFGPNIKYGLPAMANRTHKRTRTKFDKRGFPKFKSYYTIHLPITYYHKSREEHFNYANKKTYYKALKNKKIRILFTKAEMLSFSKGDTPDRFTWHHHQNRGVLQLVSRSTHSKVNHVGGYTIWGKR